MATRLPCVFRRRLAVFDVFALSCFRGERRAPQMDSMSANVLWREIGRRPGATQRGRAKLSLPHVTVYPSPHCSRAPELASGKSPPALQSSPVSAPHSSSITFSNTPSFK